MVLLLVLSTAPVPPKSFSQRIKAARKKTGLSQRRAAYAWRFNQKSLWDWENGNRNPGPHYRAKLEEASGTLRPLKQMKRKAKAASYVRCYICNRIIGIYERIGIHNVIRFNEHRHPSGMCKNCVLHQKN
jgi:transcriptional regulator with XRE-family HTH domain